MAAIESRYALSADGTNLAYQVSGEGPLDLVLLHGVATPIDLLSEEPGFVRLRKRLEFFSRITWFDARGWGASEGNPRDSLTADAFDADLTAVLDAVGLERVALVGTGLSGGKAIHFCVRHPERVSGLVLVNSWAHNVQDDDHPWGVPAEDLDDLVARVKQTWGTGAALEDLAPSRVADDRFRTWYARSTRFQGGPDQVAEAIRTAFEEDLRLLLPSISVRTLVVHREANRVVHVGAGRYLADNIPDARLVVLPGDEHLFYVGDTDAMADEIEEFLTGTRTGPEGDAFTMTVLFTDIVASTEHQTRVGPREWSRLTDHHDDIVRAALARHRGHEIKTTGDGFLATFDAAIRALRCAADIVAGAKNIGLELRAGLHTGEVAVRGDDIAGLTVTIAKRVCDLAKPQQVLVSRTVQDVVAGSGIELADRGTHELKGVPLTWQLLSFDG